ncbi:Rv3235 family protein [Brevibacterium spongiae]|uniref:Rv3235 family protein n=1 Tax=Brevibacterium spongiae TaxID=2909672 RepID=A0ABY5SSB3_9MICO|nr:Rv3235 family protein [Brevibacterium spongiae]UVI37437.1 Rv3235 family protein [Brevibacterium spongiae]
MTAPLILTRPQAPTTPPRRRATPLSTSSAGPSATARVIGLSGEAADERQRIAATAASLAVACLEVLSGVRRSDTIARWVDPELLAKIDHRAQLRAEVAPRRPASELGSQRAVQPGRTQVCRVSSGVAEVTVIVRTPNRIRAVAVRLELLTTRWTLTALQTM